MDTPTSRAWRGASVLLIAPVLFALWASGCARPAAQQAEPPPPAVTVAAVVTREISEWDEVTGRLEAVNAVDIRPRVSGLVAAVPFEEGALVRQGQLLFQIDPRPFQAAVDRLAAELARARATAQRTAAELQRAERLAGENAISTEERERRAAAAEEATAAVASMEAGLRAAQLDLEFTRVTAPIDGRVGRAIVTAGNLVSSGPGEATLLTTVVSLDPIYASFDADEATFLRYGDLARADRPGRSAQAGVPVRMAVGSTLAFAHEGRMTFLDNRVDTSTGTIRGRAVFRNRNRQLTPGQFVRLRLVGSGAAPGLLIQDRAVGTDLDKRFVYVVGGDDTVEYREVGLGPVVDGLRVVRDGLAAGDLVVVNGLQRVRPGVKVTPTRTAMDETASRGVSIGAAQ